MVSLMPQTLIFAHYDGHGVTSACLLARKLGLHQNSVLVKYKVTDPQNISHVYEAFDEDFILSAKTHIFIDIAINTKDPKSFANFFEDFVKKLMKKHPNEQPLVYYIDHHESTLKYIHLLPSVINVRFFDTALSLSRFCAEDSPNAQLLALAAAVCDRDIAVTFHPLWNEKRDLLLRIAAGIDYLVRTDLRKAIDTIYNYRIKQLETASYNIPNPPKTFDMLGNVILVYEELTEPWSIRQLEALCEQYGAGYAVGFSANKKSGGYYVKAIQYWLSRTPHVLTILKGMNLQNVRKHPYGISIPVKTKTEAYQLAVKLAQEISKVAVKEIQSQIPVIHHDLATIQSVLIQLLRQYRKSLTQQQQLIEMLNEISKKLDEIKSAIAYFKPAEEIKAPEVITETRIVTPEIEIREEQKTRGEIKESEREVVSPSEEKEKTETSEELVEKAAETPKQESTVEEESKEELSLPEIE